MRITPSILQRTLLADVQRARLQLARTQEQAGSGLRVNRPSDDPAAAARAMELRADLESLAQLDRNIGAADTRLSGSDLSLAGANEVLIRARELAVQGASDTLDAASRRILATEVEALHDELLSLSNARSGGAYLFSGYSTGTPAFSVSGPFVEGFPPPTVAFGGDSNEIELEIEEGVRLPTSLDGRRVFLGDGDGDGLPDPGRENLFDTLAALWQALVTDDRTAVGNTLDRLDAGQEQIHVERARTGARLSRLESARDARARREVETRKRLSETEDADAARVFSDLVQQETVLTAALDATARIIQPSLLEFLG